MEREERKANPERYSFGGVRTFPLIGLIGYGMALLSGGQLIALALGFAVVGALLVVSYTHKLSTENNSGVTTEVSALGTYLIGALVCHDQLWIATTITVISMFLLVLKTTLEGLTQRVPPEEIFTFTKFLLLTAVILPVLPRAAFTQFQINPFKTWLVVVAVSTVSYGSYLLLKVTRGRDGVLLSALLGGAYSSTVTTIALARRSATDRQPHLFAGGMLMASGMMYLRLALLLALFNHGLLVVLGMPFILLFTAAVFAGWLWSRMPDPSSRESVRELEPGNPLELRAALLFAALFVAMVIVTHLAIVYLGHKAVYALGGIMGLADVDPFILGIAQSAGRDVPVLVGAAGIVIAAASNNVAKGFYAYGFSERTTGRQSLSLLVGLAVAGLMPLIWLLR
ncbi:MAG TPA: DUF4010 domain-containing protein [Terriglobales bacterium]|nr:DUF4010 domain-containing protein [Terriglobales bacterium]